MADGLPDAAAADGGNDDGKRSSGQFDGSADAEFSLSTQPPSIGHRSTISVAMNHPAAAARRGAKKPVPPRRESPGRNCKRTNANAAVGRLPPRPRLPPCPPSLPPRPPLAPRKSPPVEPVDDDLIDIAAGEDGRRQGGEEAVATRVGEVLGDEVLELLSVDSSDGDAFSVQSSVHKSSVAYGNDVLCDSPTDFVEHNDPMHSDSPTDNEVSKYSFYSRLTHYMEGHKISESNRTAVELCILSEAGAFVRNMDPMKKEKKERVFFDKYLSIIDNIEDDQFENTGIPVRDIMRRIYKGAKKDNTPKSLWRKYEAELTGLRTFAKKIPGIGNLAELPSGSTQLRHMKMPLVQKLWKEKYPVRYLFCLRYVRTITTHHQYTVFTAPERRRR